MRSRLPAIHPGEFLAEILDEIGVSQAEFARAAGVSAMRVSHVVTGTRSVNADLALRFGKVLGQTPEYWLNLQAAYDLAKARDALGRQLNGVRVLPQVARAAAPRALACALERKHNAWRKASTRGADRDLRPASSQ
jgi:addiction module HigA family antidote